MPYAELVILPKPPIAGESDLAGSACILVLQNIKGLCQSACRRGFFPLLTFARSQTDTDPHQAASAAFKLLLDTPFRGW
jgi:hypothetical protein